MEEEIEKTRGIDSFGASGTLKDVKDVSGGVSSIGDAVSGDYKKLDENRRREADLKTGKAIKGVLKYIPQTSSVAKTVDKLEGVPVVGGAVTAVERSVGKNVNKAVGRVGNNIDRIPFAGKTIKNVTGNILKKSGDFIGGTKKSVDNPEEMERKLNEAKNNDRKNVVAKTKDIAVNIGKEEVKKQVKSKMIAFVIKYIVPILASAVLIIFIIAVASAVVIEVRCNMPFPPNICNSVIEKDRTEAEKAEIEEMKEEVGSDITF